MIGCHWNWSISHLLCPLKIHGLLHMMINRRHGGRAIRSRRWWAIDVGIRPNIHLWTPDGNRSNSLLTASCRSPLTHSLNEMYLVKWLLE